MRPSLTCALLFLLTLDPAAIAAGPPLKLHGLPKADFDKLPPDAQLDVGGRTLTKAQFLTELETRKPQAGVQTPPKLDLTGAQSKLDAEEKAQVEAVNAKLRADWTSVVADAKAAVTAGQGGPHIERIDGQPIRDGGEMSIHGSGFGTEPGEVRLIGPFPGGHISLTTCGGGFVQTAPIYYCAWKPHALYTTSRFGSATRTTPVTGIPDQQLQVVVVTKKGERSAPFPVEFRARRVVGELTFKDVRFKRSNSDEGPCEQSPYHTIECTEGRARPSSWHIGADEISAELRNGWKFEPRFSLAAVVWTPNGASVVGSESVQISYEKNRTSATALCFYFTLGPPWTCAIDLSAVGPEGVPFK